MKTDLPFRGNNHRLPDLPDGARVYIDANILVYGLSGGSRQCLDLLHRCARAEVAAVTLLATVNEATHRLMLAEARASGVITRESAASLRRHPAAIAQLSSYWPRMQFFLDLGVSLLPLNRNCLVEAHRWRQQYGLLTNDSVLLASMREMDLIALATADHDFERIPGLHLFRPDDLPETAVGGNLEMP